MAFMSLGPTGAVFLLDVLEQNRQNSGTGKWTLPRLVGKNANYLESLYPIPGPITMADHPFMSAQLTSKSGIIVIVVIIIVFRKESHKSI